MWTLGLLRASRRVREGGGPPHPWGPCRQAQPPATPPLPTDHKLSFLLSHLLVYFSQLFPSCRNYYSGVQVKKLRLREAQRGMAQRKGQSVRPRLAPKPGAPGPASIWAPLGATRALGPRQSHPQAASLVNRHGVK